MTTNISPNNVKKITQIISRLDQATPTEQNIQQKIFSKINIKKLNYFILVICSAHFIKIMSNSIFLKKY